MITSVTGASAFNVNLSYREKAASIFSTDFKNPIYIELAFFPARQEDNFLISNKYYCTRNLIKKQIFASGRYIEDYIY